MEDLDHEAFFENELLSGKNSSYAHNQQVGTMNVLLLSGKLDFRGLLAKLVTLTFE